MKRLMKRLSENNANYWRLYCGPHIVWLEEHLKAMRKLAIDEYEQEYLDEELPMLVGASDSNAGEMLAAALQRWHIPDLMVVLDTWKRERHDHLQHLSKFVDLEPPSSDNFKFNRLRSSAPIERYMSYAAKAADYAKGELSPYEDKMKSLNFLANVTQEDSNFVLSGNCEFWMFDALRRQITHPEAIRSFEKRNLDPSAYGLREFLK